MKMSNWDLKIKIPFAIIQKKTPNCFGKSATKYIQDIEVEN